MNLLSLDLVLPDGEELLAVATIGINPSGEYQMGFKTIVGASIDITPAVQAGALRMLATALEAEAIGRGEAIVGGA